MVLICVFLMTRNVEYVFMYMLTICVSSLEKLLFVFFATFNWMICFCYFPVELYEFLLKYIF